MATAAEPLICVTTFGAPKLTASGVRLQVPDKLIAALAVLASEPACSLNQRELVDILWGGHSQDSKASANFRQFMVRVRKIEDACDRRLLHKNRSEISYDETDIDVDLRSALSGEVLDRIKRDDTNWVRDYVEACSEPLLKDLTIDTEGFLGWISSIETRLMNNKQAALTHLLNVETEPFRLERVADRLVRLDSSHEPAYRALMRLYADQGKRAKARQTYDTCRRVLREDYGVEPSLSTEQLAAILGFRQTRVDTVVASDAPRGGMRGDTEAPALRPGKQRIGVPRVILLPPRVLLESSREIRITEALLDDITAGLTRYRSIAVLAAHTGRMTSQTECRDFEAIRKRYDVDYIVTTSITPADNGASATFMLVKADTGQSVFALDKEISEASLPSLFNRLSTEVVRLLVSAIEQSEITIPVTTDNSTAYRQFLEGRQFLWHSDLPQIRKARHKFRDAINEADTFAPAYAGLSRSLTMERLVRGLSSNELLIESLMFAERSVRLDPLDGRGMRELAFTNLYLRQHDECLANFASAVELMPSDADTLADYSDALSHAGQGEKALAIYLKAKTLNPDPPNHYDWIHASILYQLGRYEQAVEVLRPHRDKPGVARLLAASCAMSGDQASAEHFATVVRQNYPGFDLARLSELVPDKDATDTKHLFEGLSLAGLK